MNEFLLLSTLVSLGTISIGRSPPAVEGPPADVLESVAALSSPHTALFESRNLTISAGHPALESAAGIGLRDGILAGAHASSAQVERIQAAFEELFANFDSAWPGSVRMATSTRAAHAHGLRLAAWRDQGTGLAAAVVKRDNLDLEFYETGLTVGSRLLAFVPRVERLVPDLLHHLQPLPASPLELESLQVYGWTRKAWSDAGRVAWTAVHPAAPDRPLELVFDSGSGMPLAASMSFPIGQERNELSCWISYRRQGSIGDQGWLDRVISAQFMGGGMNVSSIEVIDVGFAPTADDLSLAIPADTQLEDHRSAQGYLLGPRVEWPEAIASNVRREPAADSATIAGRAGSDHSPTPPTHAPRRAWGRFLAALVTLSGILLALTPVGKRGATP